MHHATRSTGERRPFLICAEAQRRRSESFRRDARTMEVGNGDRGEPSSRARAGLNESKGRPLARGNGQDRKDEVLTQRRLSQG
ncbi:hypothetical protein EDC27_2235 [Desulfosoma caldarium]|uniref:Uncharacterized protein n=1 Tax=Desulfosoma caldarium TaxID=610254 RepID=A0A3N1UI75_9BACT|nr:hypothetical protein EDC27_2235 [Desulfosoma caldarium]